MNHRLALVAFLVCLFPLLVPGGQAACPAQQPAAPETADPETAVQEPRPPANPDDQRIQFKQFYKVEWRPIIEYYADQAGLSLRFVDLPPTGTFDYQSDRSMTLNEGLDFLNQMLIQSDRVLIRNGDLLSLYDVTKGIPDDLIQTVAADDLDRHGNYEVLNCNFDISGLEGEDLRNQLEPYISDHYRSNLTVIPAANVMIVQEIGYKLRFIRDQILGPALRSRGDWDVQQITLDHVSVEDVLVHAAAMGIQRESMSNDEGTLTLSVSPYDNQILVLGDPEQIRMFGRIVDAVDVPLGEGEIEPREPPFFQRYTVVGEAEKIHQILQTLLAGSPEVRLDYDGDSNQIYLYGRKEDHDKTVEVINQAEGSSDELAVIRIENQNVQDVIDTVETLFRQNATNTDTVDGPVLSAESQNRLIARGKPTDVAMVRKIISEIDIPYASAASQSTNRFIQMNSQELGETLNLLENMLPTLDLENRIEVVQPDQRNLFYNPNRKMFELIGGEKNGEAEAANPVDDNPVDETVPSAPDQSRRSLSLAPALLALAGPGTWSGGLLLWQEPEAPNGSGQTSQERMRRTQDELNRQQEVGSGGSGQASRERLTRDQDTLNPELPLKENVPGAPVTIRITEYGIGLQSDDYRALDRIEDLIYQNLDQSFASERIAIFLLKYLDANQAKAQLESYLGMSGGGGAAGGALGGLMGGMLNNALGGGAGDMVGGLLGGGATSTSDSGVFVTEGPVSIVANVNNYSLAVAAGPGDMELIRQLIDFIDQPEALHDPNPVGQTRVIPVVYQDVFQVEEMVKKNLAQILKNSEQGGGGGGDAAAQAQQQMLRALLGRGRGGGGGGEDDAEAPKASMSVDEKNSSLVVTGPKFAYDQILFLVRQVDVPQTGPPNEIVILPSSNMEPRQLLELLALQFPDQIEIVDATEEEGNGSSPGSAGNPNSNRPASNPNAAAEIQRRQMEAIQQMMRARSQQNQGGRGGGRGGDRGGGGRGGDR